MPFKFNPFTHKLDITEVGGGGTGILSITGNLGGAVGADGSNNINLLGSGSISLSGDPMTNTLTITSAGAFLTWSLINANQMAVSQHGYFTNGGSRVEISLPATSSVGDTFTVADLGGNGWKITQDAGQQVLFGSSFTTSGATGYLQSLFVGDSVTLVCSVANLTWMALAPVGNITIA
jgi:hypothetical protein